eukprot:scaffold31282_cov185-Isochrysis_galbana.AAC.2
MPFRLCKRRAKGALLYCARIRSALAGSWRTRPLFRPCLGTAVAAAVSCFDAALRRKAAGRALVADVQGGGSGPRMIEGVLPVKAALLIGGGATPAAIVTHEGPQHIARYGAVHAIEGRPLVSEGGVERWLVVAGATVFKDMASAIRVVPQLLRENADVALDFDHGADLEHSRLVRLEHHQATVEASAILVAAPHVASCHQLTPRAPQPGELFLPPRLRRRTLSIALDRENVGIHEEDPAVG